MVTIALNLIRMTANYCFQIQQIYSTAICKWYNWYMFFTFFKCQFVSMKKFNVVCVLSPHFMHTPNTIIVRYVFFGVAEMNI